MGRRNDAGWIGNIQQIIETGGTMSGRDLENLNQYAGMPSGYLQSIASRSFTDPEDIDKNRKSTVELQGEGQAVNVGGIDIPNDVYEKRYGKSGTHRFFEIPSKEKREIQGRLELTDEVITAESKKARAAASLNEELADKYFPSQLSRDVTRAERIGEINTTFAERLKKAPESEADENKKRTEAIKNLAMADYYRKNAIFLETKDKSSIAKYSDVLKMAAASGLVTTDPKTKMQVIKDVLPDSDEYNALVSMFKDVGLGYEEIPVSHTFRKDGVRVVPKLPSKNSTSSQTKVKARGDEIEIVNHDNTSVTLKSGKKILKNSDGTVTINKQKYKVQ